MSKLTLHTLRTGSLAHTESPPTRLVVLPWGVNKSRRGDFIVDALTCQVFEANQKKNRIDGKVALDFEHNTLPGTPAYESSSEPRPIAAWALCVVIPDEGVVYEDIEWTPDGLSAWERKLYQDLSPAPVRGADGKTVIALHSTALCRHGELEGLTISHAAAPRALAAYFDALSADSQPSTTVNDRQPSSTLLPAPMKDKLIALLAMLGITLAADADEAATATALDAGLDAAKKLKEPAKETKPEAMSAEIAGMRAELESGRKELLITKATLEGKVIPLSAEAIAATPLSALTEIVNAAKPGEVKLTKQTVEGKATTEIKPEALSAEQLAVYEACGLTAAEIEAKKAALKTAAAAA